MQSEDFEQHIPRIIEIIEEVKPSYTHYGGDVEFAGLDGDKVRIKTLGYCHR